MTFLADVAPIIGGLFGKGKDPYTPSQNIRSAAKGARRAGEEFGFNPLTLLGLGGSFPGSNGNPMLGAAIADAGMILGDSLAKNPAAQALNQSQRQNAFLQRKVENLTLRAPVAGVYGARSRGGSDALSFSAGVSGVGPETVSGVSDRHPDVLTYTAPVKPVAVQVPYISDGQVTNVPVGPDLGEFISGLTIYTWNKLKAKAKASSARRAKIDASMSFGMPLAAPRVGLPGLTGFAPYYIKSAYDLMPARAREERARSLAAFWRDFPQ